MLVTLVTTASLLLAGAFAPAGGEIQDPAALLPANTLMYVGSPSLQAGAAASKNSAMRRILDEPEVKAFLQKPVQAADKALVALLDRSGLPAEARPKMTLAGMMGGEEALPMGRFFVALTHVSLPAGEAAGEEPDVGLVIGLEMLQEADLGLVKALWSMIELPEEARSHAGQSYVVKQGGDGPPLSLAFVGRLALLSLSERALKNVLDNASAPAGGSLADTADYKELLALGGGLRADSSTFLMRVARFNDMLRSLLVLGARMEPDNAELQKFGTLLDDFGLGSIRWVGSESHREGDGRVVGTLGVAMEAEPKGLMGRLMASDRPVDPALVGEVPGNCLSMAAFSVDWLPEVYDFAEHALRTFDPAMADEVLGQVKGFMGESDLRNDVLANVNGVMLTYSLPGEGFPGTPTQIFRAGLRDGERFAKAVGAMAGALGGVFPEMKALKLVESEHEGRKLFELDVSATPAAMAMIQPAFALDDGRIVATLQSTKALKTALNGLQGSGSLAENSEFAAFIKGLSGKGTLTALSFSDVAKTFGSIYSQVAPMVSMFAGAAGDLPLDLSLMPTEQAIGKHLGYGFTGGYRTAEGLGVQHSVSHFTLTDFLPVLLTAGVVGASVVEGVGVEQEAPEVSPEERVQADLQQLSAAMTVYKISQGGYPAALSDLVKPLPDYEEGCLGRADLPLDPWGNGYNFRLNEKKKPFLWSAGPNGVDEGGAGDDIAKK